jgi:hypothetical protein
MSKKALTDGYLWFALGLLCSSIVSLLDRFAGVGRMANFARGVLDGLSIVAFGAAIFVLVSERARRNELD